MSIPDELLMAYADGELNDAEHASERAKVEAAIKADADVGRRVEQHRALRARLSTSFDRVLDEPVPDRLIAAIRRAPAAAASDNQTRLPSAVAPDSGTRLPAAAAPDNQTRSPPAAPGTGAPAGPDSADSTTRRATVSDLSSARAARAATAADAAKSQSKWTWPQWGAMAASLIIGAIIGHVALQSPEASPIVARDGRLVAQANLAEALSNQLASTQTANTSVQIGTSFKAKDGAYCRTFVLHEGDAMGGLACRAGNGWNVNTLARAETTPGTDGGYRPAGSEMPDAVRAAVEAQIVGDPLDSSGEAQAKGNGWK
jgi:anti-sigma factor RsiW